MAQAGLRLKSHIQLESEVFGFVLVRVISWIVFIYLDKRNDPRSHTNYTRNSLRPSRIIFLVAIEIDC